MRNIEGRQRDSRWVNTALFGLTSAVLGTGLGCHFRGTEEHEKQNDSAVAESPTGDSLAPLDFSDPQSVEGVSVNRLDSLPSCNRDEERQQTNNLPEATTLDPDKAIISLEFSTPTFTLEGKSDESMPKKLEPPTYKAVIFSNGMRANLCIEQTVENGISVYRIDTGYGREFDILVYDPGDGNPYVWQKLDLKGNNREKRFKLTYNFEGTEYPIWEPTAFRSHPNYGG